MGQKTLIVSLETENDDSLTLKKGVENCLKRTFGDVLDYMLNPLEDSQNPPYNEDERELCSVISDLRNSSSKEIFFLKYRTQENKSSPPINDLNHTLEEYSNIVIDREDISSTGEKIKYKGISLIAGIIPYGG